MVIVMVVYSKHTTLKKFWKQFWQINLDFYSVLVCGPITHLSLSHPKMYNIPLWTVDSSKIVKFPERNEILPSPAL